MNLSNYGTREACQKLVEAGIVLETEFAWFYDGFRWWLEYDTDENRDKYSKHIPAPSLAEAWREMPPGIEIYKDEATFCLLYRPIGRRYETYKAWGENDNPTDALIYLKIWIVEQEAAHD